MPDDDHPFEHAERRLSVVGCGIKAASQVTLEGLRSARSASRVLSLSLSPADVDAWTAMLNGIAVADLDELYLDGAVDGDNYDRIFRRVVSELEEHGNVCLLMYGHPRLGVSLTTRLERHCADSGIDFRVVPGVSSLDAMMGDLRRDPLERGSIVLDANRLLLFKFELDPGLDWYIYHVCSVGVARTHYTNPAIGNRLELLRDHLRQFRDADDPVTLISSASSDAGKTDSLTLPLRDLTRILPRLRFESTLFVPAAAPRSVDRTFLHLLTSVRDETHDTADASAL
jgi:uncharacterized protein YabN with tetrapyrrole methylase and pyrophosphatase domain